jgi:hypothetical protein
MFVVVDLPAGTVRCQACMQAWNVRDATGARLATWWVCPNGCNG